MLVILISTCTSPWKTHIDFIQTFPERGVLTPQNVMHRSVKGQNPKQQALTDGGRKICKENQGKCGDQPQSPDLCSQICRSSWPLQIQAYLAWKSPVCKCSQKPEKFGPQSFCNKEWAGIVLSVLLSVPWNYLPSEKRILFLVSVKF